jgi:tetratricopeptide (TPR) repeat protein
LNTADLTSLLKDSDRLGDQGFVDELLDAIRRSGMPTSEATKRIDLALSTFRNLWTGSDEASVPVLANLAESYARLGGLEKAETLYTEVIALASAVDDKPQSADALRRRGRTKRRQNRWQAALEDTEAARAAFVALGDDLGIARCLQAEGIIHREQANFEGARAAYANALETGERLDHAPLIHASTTNLAIVELMVGAYDNALAGFEHSLIKARELGSESSECRAYHNLGLCHTFRESWGEALDNYEKSLEISERTGLLDMAWKSYVQKGHVYLSLKDSTLAATYCARALDISEEIGTPLGKANAYRVLGRLVGERGDYATGTSILNQGLAIFQSYQDPLGEGEVLREIGELQLERDGADAGNQTLQTAIDIFERIGAQGEVDRTRALLAN